MATPILLLGGAAAALFLAMRKQGAPAPTGSTLDPWDENLIEMEPKESASAKATGNEPEHSGTSGVMTGPPVGSAAIASAGDGSVVSVSNDGAGVKIMEETGGSGQAPTVPTSPSAPIGAGLSAPCTDCGGKTPEPTPGTDNIAEASGELLGSLWTQVSSGFGAVAPTSKDLNRELLTLGPKMGAIW